MSKITDYFRPNRKWECGRAKDGNPCHLGPDKAGKCISRFECTPSKDGNGYICSRPPQFGGKCETGPLPDGSCCKRISPCSPSRTTRSKRNLVTICFIAFSLGVILFNIGKPEPNLEFVSPGALSSPHSSIKHNCATCHKGAHGGTLDWLMASKSPFVESKSCMECHSMGKHAIAPHSSDPHKMAEITKRMLAGSTKKHHKAPSEMQCMNCHKEHRGVNADLKIIADNQCQSCHVQKFKSFAKGHPEFENYPFARRTKIYFDHTSHFAKHFQNADHKAKAINCQSCHKINQSMRMDIYDFKQACADCHGSEILGKDKINKSIAFFSIPGMDLETLEAKKKHIGSWPADAEAEITPFIKILLSTNEKNKAALEKIKDVDLTDLSEVEDDVVAASRKIAWEIKSLLLDLATEGKESLQTRLKQVFTREFTDEEIAELMSALPLDVVRNASQQWFKNLAQEVESYRGDRFKKTTEFEVSELSTEDEDWMKSGGWFRSEDFSIKYRPTGHEDKFVKSWLDLTSKLSKVNEAGSMIFHALADEKKIPGSCLKCHAVDQLPNNEYKVNWNAKRTAADKSPFVKFDHSSHFSLISEKGCFTCHQINPEAKYDKAFKGYDIKVFESNFQPVKKESCVTCHQGKKVKDSCLSCHSYHNSTSFSTNDKMQHIKTEY